MTRAGRLSALSLAKRWGMRLISYLHAQPLGDGEHVLVAAAAEVHHQEIVFGRRRREYGDMGQRVRGFERGNDTLELAQELEGSQRLVVGRRHVLDPALLLQPGMLGPDAGIVEAGRDRVCLLDLAFLVLQEI